MSARVWPDTSVERFWKMVHKTEDGCWLFTGSLVKGYGQFRVTGARRNTRAHKYSYELHNGPVPAGMFVCHRCDVRNCVNPEHLFAGTCQDNLRDAARKGRQWNQRIGPEEAIQIRKLLAAGYTQKSVAEHYGLAQTTVGKIHRRLGVC